MNLKGVPKIELHLHLDCSLSFEVVHKINAEITEEEYLTNFRAGSSCHSLRDYLGRAVRAVELMQDETSLRLATLDLFDQLRRDNILYAEIRFAPFLHTHMDLRVEEVIEIVNAAIAEGIGKTNVEASLILCTLRHFSEEKSMKTAELVKTFEGTPVCGFDIAADEAGHPIYNHISAFKYAKAEGLNVTAHAGEACGPESVWETLDNFYPMRIGHGVRSIEDPELIEYLLKENIHLEVCPTSNIQTGIYPSFDHHVADELFSRGISMSINTDGRTISNTDLVSEYERMAINFNWTEEQFYVCNMNAIDASFISPAKKRALRDRFTNRWNRATGNKKK